LNFELHCFCLNANVMSITLVQREKPHQSEIATARTWYVGYWYELYRRLYRI
jgi:hypothetical protein